MTEANRNDLLEIIENLNVQARKLKDLAVSESAKNSSGFEGLEEMVETLNEVSNWISQHVVDLKDLIETE